MTTADGCRAESAGSVLLVEDDRDQAAILEAVLRHEGFRVLLATTGEQALSLHWSKPVQVVLTDLVLPGMSGLDLIRRLASGDGDVAGGPRVSVPAVVVMTGAASVATAVEALQLGAVDYLRKPLDPARCVALVRELLRASPGRERDLDDSELPNRAHVFEGMVGDSPPMLQMFRRIERVAGTSAPVLIVGESGTGKELVARAVHNRSPRRDYPLVPVHTGAIPRELIASELFGHEKGSFTGAFAAAEGKFEAAAGGSIFLDEVGTMIEAVQVSLLRVLESYRFTRVGGRKELAADVRVIAATNRDLLDLVDERIFREDLYYRLNVFTITLPPLRARGSDVIAMAERFLVKFATQYGTSARRLSPAAVERLLEHAWPGNVRELRNTMEQTALFACRELVGADEVQLGQGRLERRLPRAEGQPDRVVGFAVAVGPDPNEEQPVASAANTDEREPVEVLLAAPPHAAPLPAVLDPTEISGETPPESDHPLVLRVSVGTRLADAERELILLTVDAVRGNKVRAARLLGISRRGLYAKLQVYGVHIPRSEQEDRENLPEAGSSIDPMQSPSCSDVAVSDAL